jgi:hypothetical protein
MNDFANAQEIHKAFPGTFEVPSNEELNAVVTGDFVKICHMEERFWVKVVSVIDSLVVGTVENELITSTLKYGETVTFTLDNIYSVTVPDRPDIISEAENIQFFCPSCNSGSDE